MHEGVARRLDRRRALQAGGIGVSSLVLPRAARASSYDDFATSGTTDGLVVGEAAFGGYFAGIIDTLYRQNDPNFDVAWTSPTERDYGFRTAPYGERYALIVSPRDYEPTAGVNWGDDNSAGFDMAFSRWNGRATTAWATDEVGLGRLPAFQFISDLNANAFASSGTANGVSIRGGAMSTAVPADGGSPWYLPALDELDLLYRAFKPTETANRRRADDRNEAYKAFPVNQPDGRNWSLETPSYGHTTAPGRTTVAAFQSGGAQALAASTYWSATVNKYTDHTFWSQNMDDGGQDEWGTQGYALRAVRRVEIYDPYASV